MLINTPTAAAFAGLATGTFREIARKSPEMLPCKKKGRYLFYNFSDVDRFVRVREKQLKERVTRNGGMGALIHSLQRRLSNHRDLLAECNDVIDMLLSEQGN